jgi:hypothetical protein
MILTLTLLFSSCQTDNTADGDIPATMDLQDGTTVKLANNKAVDFYFYYPQNWVFPNSRDDLMITIYVNEANMTKPNISAWVFTPAFSYESIDEYWNDFAVPDLEGIFPDVGSAEAQELTLDGIAAKKYTYTRSSADTNYKISQIVALRNTQVYVLTYTATEDKYDTYAKVLDVVVETFKFK